MKHLILGAIAVAAATAATAGPVAVTSYDLPNGSGQASGGTYNYWDGTYTGTGAKTVDGAPLIGGRGVLTDGVASTLTWQNTSNTAGTGESVGWLYSTTLDPVVTFHFAPGSTITAITVTYDNSTAGGVFAPGKILIDGVDTLYSPNGLGGVGTTTFSGLSLTGTAHTIEFDQNGQSWAFISEVAFAGGTVPEPAAWAMMIGGFGLVGAASRRRRAVVAA